MEHQNYVYIMTNQGHNVLYTGVTNDLARRVYEHRHGQADGFTKKYQVNQLVYFEMHEDVQEALAREKKIKGGSRKKKMELIQGMNEYWFGLGGKAGVGRSLNGRLLRCARNDSYFFIHDSVFRPASWQDESELSG